jgi:hypothetical protein
MFDFIIIRMKPHFISVTSNKMLYVGAGYNINPVIHFPKTKMFVFIDSQPRSQHDNIYGKYSKHFYKNTFRDKLVKKYKEHGFILHSYRILNPNYSNEIMTWKQYILSWYESIPTDVNPSLLTFKNKETEQTIRYYISTNIRRNLGIRLYKDIQTCDTLIISSYYPESEILNIFDSPKIFIGYNDTNYRVNTNEFNKNYDNNIIYYLQLNPHKVSNYFSLICMVDSETGDKFVCESYDHFVGLASKLIHL